MLMILMLFLSSGGVSSTFGSPCLKLTTTCDFCFVGHAATGCLVASSPSKFLIIFHCWSLSMVGMGREGV